ncbi:MAG: Gfo/Idh/MocA family oxidoreductase [Planctomycetota bacterium]|jgi:predicted dehydrogenase|nr:Gfo/Idh/MocA family oxidoreductase [Planctomycetota bacterium]
MEPLSIQHRPILPEKMDSGIALCGAGGIVNHAHLPAYRKAGYNVVGIFDTNTEAAEATAASFEIPEVYESLEQLTEDEAAEVVDIAVPATENLQIASAVAAAGKPMLMQKPLAEDWDSALKTVEVIDRYGVHAAVNQQMRWEPGVRASKDLLDRGLLGELFNIAALIFVDTPWHLWGWLMKKPTIEVMYHSIHYLDSIRFLTGQEPTHVFCDGTTRPNYEVAGETRLNFHLFFDGELRATMLTNHHASNGLEGQQADFRVEGTEGATIRSMGVLMNYPEGISDTFRFSSRQLGERRWTSIEFEETWFPDAFIGPMASLMRAEHGEIDRPETDVHDNLKTLRVVFAAYDSMRERNVVEVGSTE